MSGLSPLFSDVFELGDGMPPLSVVYAAALELIKCVHVHASPEVELQLAFAEDVQDLVPLLFYAIQDYADDGAITLKKEEVEDVHAVLSMLLL